MLASNRNPWLNSSQKNSIATLKSIEVSSNGLPMNFLSGYITRVYFTYFSVRFRKWLYRNTLLFSLFRIYQWLTEISVLAIRVLYLDYAYSSFLKLLSIVSIDWLNWIYLQCLSRWFEWNIDGCVHQVDNLSSSNLSVSDLYSLYELPRYDTWKALIVVHISSYEINF